MYKSLNQFLVIILLIFFPIQVFAKNIYIGAFADINNDGHTTQADIDSTEEMFGKNIYFVKLYKQWFQPYSFSKYQNFEANYKPEIDTILKNGSIPFIEWEAWDLRNNRIILDEVNEGRHDNYIKQTAQKFKTYYPEQKIFISLFHEANLDVYPWSPVVGTSAEDESRQYDNFRKAYRRVRDIFRTEGLDNISWVISYNNFTDYKLSKDFSNYYPGADYIDWVGIDAYNWGTTQWWSKWQTFDEIIEGNSDSYNQLKLFEKPIILAETAATEIGGDKASWIKNTFAKMLEYDFAGFIWFNTKKETNWRIDSSFNALIAFKDSIKNTSYYGSTTNLPSQNNNAEVTTPSDEQEILTPSDKKEVSPVNSNLPKSHIFEDTLLRFLQRSKIFSQVQ